MSSSSNEKAGERFVIYEVNERDFIMQGIISYIERESWVQVIKCLGPKNWLEYDSYVEWQEKLKLIFKWTPFWYACRAEWS